MMAKTIEIAGLLFTVRDIVVVVFYIVLFILTTVAFLIFTSRKAWRFFSNVQKPILFLNLTNATNGMSFEADMAHRTGFLARPTVSNDARQTELLDQNNLVVLAVNDDTNVQTFTDVYNSIKTKGKPVILYTLGERDTVFLRTAPQTGLIKSYSLHTISTTPLRLISDIFSILSIQNIE